MEINIKKFSSRLIDILKSDGAANNIVSIVAFMLLLKKRGLLSDIKNYLYGNDVAYEFITSMLYNHSGGQKLIDVWDIVGNDFKMLKENSIKELSYMLDDILEGDLNVIFDEIITQNASNFSDGIGMSFQPTEVAKLIFKLGDSNRPMEVYNPFAGLASYGIYFGKNHHYVAQEINKHTWALGKIRLLLNDAYVYDYKLEDSIHNWNSLNQKYDLLVSSPPFGHWTNKYLYSESNTLPASSCEEFFIINGINSCLRPQGKLIGIFSEGLLFGSKNSQRFLRKELIEAGIVEMVISLPVNIMYNTAIKTSIVILNKQKTNEYVKIVDGSQFIRKEGKRNILQEEELFQAIISDDKQFVRFVSFSDIKNNSYNLSVSRYFIEKVKSKSGYPVVSIGELVTLSNSKSHSNGGGYLISVSDLSDNAFDYELDPSEVNFRTNIANQKKADSDVLLVASRHKLFKPTFCKASPENPIYYTPNIIAFKVNTDVIDIAYLVYQLNSEYVQKQKKALSVGSVLSMISIKDLRNIQIILPPLEEQKAIVQGAKESYQIASAKELGLEELIEKMKTEYIDEMRIKKHNLAQYINSLQSSVSALIKFIKKHNGAISEEQLISIHRNITVDQHLQDMLNTTKEIGTFVNNLTNDLEFKNATNINLNDFIQLYIDSYPQDKFELKYYFDKESFIDNNKSFAPIIKISEPNLEEVFNKIVENAENHGFVDTTKKNYIISILLSFDINKNMLRIDIANNGKPMSLGMNKFRYTLKNEKAGITGNEGLGGFRINQIIGHFGGELNLNMNEQDEFPVTITLYLPLIKIES
jgi:Type I restriction-modification system methyltransferase subunit